jgi:hypothetical protein
MIDYRGNPTRNDPVHYQTNTNNTNVFCYFGSYHIRYTADAKKVTCLKCMKHPYVVAATKSLRK